MRCVHVQGTEAELQVHRDESMTHHLEMCALCVEHKMGVGQVGLDVATITRQTQVISLIPVHHLYTSSGFYSALEIVNIIIIIITTTINTPVLQSVVVSATVAEMVSSTV